MTAVELLQRTTAGKGIRVASFFSGAGGLDLGFELTGFEIVYATDIDIICCDSLKANVGKLLSQDTIVRQQDIRNIKLEELPKSVDLVIGGPPCQSFSASGRRAGGAAGSLDSRGTLFEAYCKVIKYLRPKAFLFENVRGILGTNKGKDWSAILSAFNSIGYKTDYRILDALDYGAPQQRERMILVGHVLENEFLFPKPLFGPDSSLGKPHITAEQVLENIENDTEDKQALILKDGKYAHLLPLVPHGQNYLYFTGKRGYSEPIFAYRSRFSDFLYKADPKAPIKTLIASPGKYTGPFHWNNRSFTIREYMRLQGFPDRYMFTGARSDRIKQIGNSVSPMLSYQLALAIAKQVFSRKVSMELLRAGQILSFDKRKGRKAAQTKNIHASISKTKKNGQTFRLKKYSEKLNMGGNILSVQASHEDTVATLLIREKDIRKMALKITLEIFQNEVEVMAYEENITPQATLNASVYCQPEYAAQAVWNAIDHWVVESSNYHSLFEIYGHFTEPHPVFYIKETKCFIKHPVLSFFEHIARFENCSRYFPRKHLTELFDMKASKSNFLNLVEFLRKYRFDIRCSETNIAIPSDVYMVAYPFTLPMSKQMNFSIKKIS